MHPESKTLRLVPFFSALCMFLAAVEYAIPKPLPFTRLGIANLPVMISLSVMKKRETALLILFKVLAQSIITGTLFSYISIFSVAGSFASGFAMMGLYILFGKNKISNVGLSLGGALANNAAQIFLAYLFFFGQNTKYIAPILLLAGTVSGFILGVFANAFCNKSEWYKKLTEGIFSQKNFDTAEMSESAADSKKAKIQFIIALCIFPIFMFLPKILAIVCNKIEIKLTPASNVIATWICVAIFLAMTLIKKHGKVKILPSVFLTIFITIFALLTPNGKILYTIGKFRVTEEALLTGLQKSARLVGMVFLSQFAISPRLNLPGKIGKFLHEVFAIFDMFTAERIQFKRGKIISSLDSRLCELLP